MTQVIRVGRNPTLFKLAYKNHLTDKTNVDGYAYMRYSIGVSAVSKTMGCSQPLDRMDVHIAEFERKVRRLNTQTIVIKTRLIRAPGSDITGYLVFEYIWGINRNILIIN
ncbi:hypothetical protein AG1IA_06047 [Rhizoctonia solani AG-1 IA]|uniref:Uncharacterized protein n=1 Tax=Thanatephorus cucumeris (strain AG1-IA) TaxID=983506 RepID=L8WSZ4_THACA|nr:hypothetical protein AG1IA_06047 [Rhizoctonia solani AG-1 IA]